MTRFARICRDLCLIGVGVINIFVTPPSVRDAGFAGAVAYIWAAMIGFGACMSLYGLLSRRIKAEAFGCGIVGAGFLIWFIAAVTKHDANWTSLAVGLVFLSGTFGQLYRIGMVSEGRVIR
jgi:hypothetical protein